MISNEELEHRKNYTKEFFQDEEIEEEDLEQLILEFQMLSREEFKNKLIRDFGDFI